MTAKQETGPWDAEVDVVVVGFGGAGVCAALEAAQQGPRCWCWTAAMEVGQRPPAAVSYMREVARHTRRQMWIRLHATHRRRGRLKKFRL